jgi:hypothetical protein
MQTHAKFEMGNFDVSLKVITLIVLDTLDDVDVDLHFFIQTLLHLSLSKFMKSGL